MVRLRETSWKALPAGDDAASDKRQAIPRARLEALGDPFALNFEDGFEALSITEGILQEDGIVDDEFVSEDVYSNDL